jgi:hypothetical protein
MHDSLSPVNSLRIVFNQLFGESLSMLDNRSRFSTWDYPYVFFDIDSMMEAKME